MTTPLWKCLPLAPLTQGVLLGVVAMLASGTAALAQVQYDTADAATEALVSAVKADDVQRVLEILGPGGGSIINSGDPVADASARQRFVTAYDTKHEIAPDGSNRATLVIGDNDWPLPIPLVQSKGKWRFDSIAGSQEVLYRRIGENESDAIHVALAYVQAQREYADADPLGKGAHGYAQRLVSQPGTKDGLYWPSDPGQAESPLGPAVAEASSEGYRPGSGEPYHGYYYKILTGQGPAAKGGQEDYILNGQMIGGFALVAYPAQYRNSGVMTFIVNYDGVVLQKDLGPQTLKVAARLDRFNPDSGWVPAQPIAGGETE